MPQITFDKLRAPCIGKERMKGIECCKLCVESINKYLSELKKVDFSKGQEQEMFSDASKEFKAYWTKLGVNNIEECCYCFNYMSRTGRLQSSGDEDIVMRSSEAFLSIIWSSDFFSCEVLKSLCEKINEYIEKGLSKDNDDDKKLIDKLKELVTQLNSHQRILKALSNESIKSKPVTRGKFSSSDV